MSFKTIVLLLSILPAVLLQKTCSISIISRRSCQYPVITDETACKYVGCCFDSSPRTPKSGRCYKQGRLLHLGHIGLFNPTAAPPSSGIGGGNQYRVMGGSPGHQGSVATVKCDPLKLCKWSNQYHQNRRNDCVRQGCCWRSGQCWANIYTIISLRSTCAPGFKNPPKCEEHYPCQDIPNPCKNGGTCVDVRPGNFKCTCLTGFSGVTCIVRYKISMTPRKGKYDEVRQMCRDIGGDLLQKCLSRLVDGITYKDEIGAYVDLTHNAFWIGINDRKKEGRWTYLDEGIFNGHSSDGEDLLYYWENGQPQNVEDCGGIKLASKRLHDYMCYDEFYGLCEVPY